MSTGTLKAASPGSSPIHPMSVTIMGTPQARQSPTVADASPEKVARSCTASLARLNQSR